MAHKRAPDWSNLFPHCKIKAQLTRDDDVGRLSQKTIQLISISSALFLEHIVRKAVAIMASKDKEALTLLNLRDATDPFLHHVLDGITEESAPKRIRKRTLATKQNKLQAEMPYKPSVVDVFTLNRVVESTSFNGSTSQVIEVIQDVEDYD
jgi:hypothetical protein